MEAVAVEVEVVVVDGGKLHLQEEEEEAGRQEMEATLLPHHPQEAVGARPRLPHRAAVDGVNPARAVGVNPGERGQDFSKGCSKVSSPSSQKEVSE